MNSLAGTRQLVRLALRRDRIQLPMWIVVLILVQVASMASVIDLYPTEADRLEFAIGSAKSPVAVAFNGIVTGSSMGALIASQTLMILAVGAALMSTLCVVRHTRQNEETGRAELLGAAVTGRHALLTAGLLVAAIADVLVGLGNTLVLLAYGLPVGGSLAMGAAISLVGIAFAAIAAVAAQLPEGARAANGMAGAALGAAFLLRGVGDATGHLIDNGATIVSGWLSWLSPIGWGQQIRPYYDNRWWTLLLPVGLTVVLVGVAYAVADRRDLGAGVLATRPGRAAARANLVSPLGLAWRLQRGVLIGWVAGVAVVGAVYGAIGNDIDDLIGSSDQVSNLIDDLGGGSSNLTDAYFAAILGFMGIAVSAYAVQALLRLRGEESAGRLEPLLATGVSRTRLLASHAIVAVLGIVTLLAVTGLAIGLTYAAMIGDAGAAPRVIGAALVQIPAALVMAGLVLAIFGLLPRWAAAISWGALGIFLLLGQLGRLLGLPDAVLQVSPFSHEPALPAVALRIAPVVSLAVIGIALAGVGFAGFRRRDIVA